MASVSSQPAIGISILLKVAQNGCGQLIQEK